MRACIVLATLIGSASSIAQPAPKPSIAPGVERFGPSVSSSARLDCVAARVQHAQRRDTSRSQRLDELPPGVVYLTVMRKVDGCEIPVLASEERARLRR